MQRLTELQSVAAVLRQSDIDTDVIYPARFLLITEREGLGTYAFHDWRFDSKGREQPHFVLNQTAYRETQVLVTGRNFGCGSSREQATWSLADRGIRCVLAESFGEIFESNCYGSGILPVKVEPGAWAALADNAEAGLAINVNLLASHVRCGEQILPIPIPGWRREALLNGWDEIDLVLSRQKDAITAFEQKQRQHFPWLYSTNA